MSNLFRSGKTQAAYKERLKLLPPDHCVMCERVPIESFAQWKVIKNHFPYDLIAETHDMIVPLRHVVEAELNDDEKAELLKIKSGHLDRYEYVVEAMNFRKSMPEHFHLHLIVAKSLPGADPV